MTPIAITGMHRSGTSMIARALRLAGLYLGEDGDLLEPAPDNPEGFFEHAGFVRLNEDLLEATQGAWDHPPPHGPLAATEPRVAPLTGRARALIDSLGVHPDWGWKDPRTCLTAPFWLDLVPGLRFVVCVRNPLEVAASLHRRNRVSFALGLSLWDAYYGAILGGVPEERRLVTHYDAHGANGGGALNRLLEFTGLPEDALPRARAAYKPELRHQYIQLRLADADVSPAVATMYRRLCEEAQYPVEADGPRPGTGHLRRAVVDLALAKRDLQRRDSHIATLERQRADLEGRVAALEAAAREQTSIDRLDRRLEAVEDALTELRYRVEPGPGGDAGVVHACRRLVRQYVPRHARVAIVAKGDPALLDLYGRPTVNFPSEPGAGYPGFPPAESAAAIAHLEAHRLWGTRFLLVPETARWWLDHYREFAEHLVSRYATVTDTTGGGLLVDLTKRRPQIATWPRSVTGLLRGLVGPNRAPPSVLDWTSRSNVRLAGANVFSTPAPNGVLPYADGTIDVVIVDDAGALAEARRVARMAVVTVSDDVVPTVGGVEVLGDPPPATDPSMVVVVGGEMAADDPWLAALADVVEEEPAVQLRVVAPREPLVTAGAEIVVVVEPGVLPLPGCLASLRSTMGTIEDVGGVAVKLLDARGAIEAAGTTVFADGSVLPVAAGAYESAAPWHEYVRPTCGGAGLFALRAQARAVLGPAGVPGAATFTAWAGELWAGGWRVVYQPDAVGVRTDRRSADTPTDRDALRAWSPVLEHRPEPGSPADASFWRALLAGDDVEAAWR